MIEFEHVPAVLAPRHTLLEGPCPTRGGIAYSDVIDGGVYLATTEGERRVLLAGRRGIGGLAAAGGDGLIVTGRDVALLDRDGGLETLYADPTAAGFNDLAVLHDSTVAVGVLRFAAMAGEAPVPGEVVRIGAGERPEVLVEDILWPNGIAQSSDGAILICDFARAHVKRVSADGVGEVFFEVSGGSCDGCALDAEGARWLAPGHGGRRERVAADGKPLGSFDVPAEFVSSVCLTDEWIYVTTADNLASPATGGSLLRARAEVPPAPKVLAAFG